MHPPRDKDLHALSSQRLNGKLHGRILASARDSVRYKLRLCDVSYDVVLVEMKA